MVVVAVAWGACFPLLDWGTRGGSRLWFVTWRAAIAGFVLLCVCLVARRRAADRMPPLSLRVWALICALAILNVTLAFAAMAASVAAVTAGIASILGNAQALLVVLPAWWLFGERPRVLQIIGVAIGFGGLTLIVGPAGGGRGAWLALLAAATIAAGALLARELASVDIWMLGAAQFLIGAAILAVIAAIAEGPPVNGWTVNFVIALSTLALLGTALPYALWFAELRRASIAAVMSWTLLVPVVGLVLSVLVLGESLTEKQLLGTAIVVAAMALVARSGRPHSDRPCRPAAQRQ